MAFDHTGAGHAHELWLDSHLVDAGAAGTAALTVALVSGLRPQEALDQACVVGALATTKMGAQSSPDSKSVQELTRTIGELKTVMFSNVPIPEEVPQ